MFFTLMPAHYVTLHVICIDAYQLMQVSCSKCTAAPLEEGQVGRVEQHSYVESGPHMGLGIQSYILDAWFTHITVMIHVSIISLAS